MSIRTQTNTVSRAANTVSRGRGTDTQRNDARFELRERLKEPLAASLKQVPSKQLAQATGISWRTIEDLRTGLRMCDLPDALLISRAMPHSPFANELRAFLLITGNTEADHAFVTEIVRTTPTRER